mgnify:CR=1 FL=1
MPITSLKEIRKFKKGTKIKAKGVVSCVPGILGQQIFYVAGSGIQVYLYDKNFPKLNLGDEIEISGELSSYDNEARINLSSKNDIKILQKDQPINLEEIKISEINENTEGYLVKIKGEITETSGNVFYVSDETNKPIQVYIKESTNIEKPRMTKGDQVEITGIVSQNKLEYRILPRFQSDILMIEKSNEQPVTSNEHNDTNPNDKIRIKNQELRITEKENQNKNQESGIKNQGENENQNTNIKTKEQEEKSKTKEAAATVGIGSSAILAALYRRQIFLFLGGLFKKRS